jgi:hypothetical protein
MHPILETLPVKILDWETSSVGLPVGLYYHAHVPYGVSVDQAEQELKSKLYGSSPYRAVAISETAGFRNLAPDQIRSGSRNPIYLNTQYRSFVANGHQVQGLGISIQGLFVAHQLSLGGSVEHPDFMQACDAAHLFLVNASSYHSEIPVDVTMTAEAAWTATINDALRPTNVFVRIVKVNTGYIRVLGFEPEINAVVTKARQFSISSSSA